MPDNTVEPNNFHDPADLLSKYQASSKTKGGTFWKIFANAAGAAKKRGVALKLLHEVKSLQTAIDAQLESLGALMLTHRPDTVDIDSQIAELSHIQNELSQKQTTLESLRQTKGSKTVVKELDREVSQLHSRQKTVMVAIGRMALDARADMPGASGPYAALDRLESSLKSKQAEKEQLDIDLGSVSEPNIFSAHGVKRWLIGTGAIAGAGILIWMLCLVFTSGLFGAKLPSWTRQYVTYNTQAVAYFNMNNFRKTDLYEKVEKLFPSRTEMKQRSGLVLQPKQIRDIFVVFGENGMCTFFRTYDDMPLDEVVSKKGRDDNPEKYKGYEYVRSGREYVTKVAKCTYCEASSEDEVERMLRNLARNEPSKIDKDLKRALELVGGEDYFIAGTTSFPIENMSISGASRQLKRALKQAICTTATLSIGSTIKLQNCTVFENSEDAEDFQYALESIGRDIEDAKYDDVPYRIRRFVKLAEDICCDTTTLYHKGNNVYIQIEIESSDVEDLIDDIHDRPMSRNNMRQIELALHNYAQAHRMFPPAYSANRKGKPLLSWRVLILPYLEGTNIYKEFHLDEPWDSDHNKKLIGKMPDVYKSPTSKVASQGKTNYLTVRGKGTIFADEKGCTFSSIRDGTSNTIAMVEVSDANAVTWTRPDDYEYDLRNPIKGLIGFRRGGFLAGFADGSVTFVRSSIKPEKLKLLFTKADGQTVTLND